MKRIMEIADKICVQSGSVGSSRPTSKPATLSRGSKGALTDKGGREGKGGKTGKSAEGSGFEIMANVIWAELGKAVMDELGSIIFAAGNPDEFRQVRPHPFRSSHKDV